MTGVLTRAHLASSRAPSAPWLGARLLLGGARSAPYRVRVGKRTDDARAGGGLASRGAGAAAGVRLGPGAEGEGCEAELGRLPVRCGRHLLYTRNASARLKALCLSPSLFPFFPYCPHIFFCVPTPIKKGGRHTHTHTCPTTPSRSRSQRPPSPRRRTQAWFLPEGERLTLRTR